MLLFTASIWNFIMYISMFLGHVFFGWALYVSRLTITTVKYKWWHQLVSPGLKCVKEMMKYICETLFKISLIENWHLLSGEGLSASYTTLVTWLLSLVPDNFDFLKARVEEPVFASAPFYVLGMQQMFTNGELQLSVAVTPVEKFTPRDAPGRTKAKTKVVSFTYYITGPLLLYCGGFNKHGFVILSFNGAKSKLKVLYSLFQYFKFCSTLSFKFSP